MYTEIFKWHQITQNFTVGPFEGNNNYKVGRSVQRENNHSRQFFSKAKIRIFESKLANYQIAFWKFAKTRS